MTSNDTGKPDIAGNMTLEEAAKHWTSEKINPNGSSTDPAGGKVKKETQNPDATIPVKEETKDPAQLLKNQTGE